MTTTITLVVPVHNEARDIRANLASILEQAGSDDYRIELIPVDDGSTDTSASEIAAAAAADPRIHPLYLTRNFGKEAAMQAGLQAASGNAVVILDADLQHPPALIPEMVRHWRNGILIVEAVKAERGDESRASGLFAAGFYWLFRHLAGMDLRDHSDFKLLDRVVVDYYSALPERRRFLRGLIHWTGYPALRIPFNVAERAGGTSSWSRLKLMRYALDNLTSFTSLPLYLISIMGALTLSFGLIMAAVSLYQKWQDQALDGFTTVNLLIITMSAALMISQGIIGHYLARIYDEIKQRPSYLLKPPPADRT